MSPRGKKKSLFNPAEMEKMRIRNSRMSQVRSLIHELFPFIMLVLLGAWDSTVFPINMSQLGSSSSFPLLLNVPF